MYEKSNQIPFAEIQESYSTQNYYCNSKKTYNKRQHRIKSIPCNQFSCRRCRPSLKNQLFYNIINTICIFGFDKHLILTSQGENYRNNTTWTQSFNDMPKSWNKYKQVIQYKYGKFDYILLPRSQKDGFCHYHIILNSKYIPHSFLDKKRKKYSNMGYVSIQTNQTLYNYLTNDFYKDHEYIIPENKRHFYGSNEVKKYLSINMDKNPDNYPLVQNHYSTDPLKQHEQQIYEITGYPLPFEEYLKYFCSIEQEKLPLLSGLYINGKLKNPNH